MTRRSITVCLAGETCAQTIDLRPFRGNCLREGLDSPRGAASPEQLLYLPNKRTQFNLLAASERIELVIIFATRFRSVQLSFRSSGQVDGRHRCARPASLGFSFWTFPRRIARALQRRTFMRRWLAKGACLGAQKCASCVNKRATLRAHKATKFALVYI